MNIKDLTIGNYVMITEHNDVDIIIGISECGFIDLLTINEVNITDISPIKITSTILERNGFILDEIANDWTKGAITISGRESPYFVSGIEIQYIHELQNIVKLLGYDLGELDFSALNFKKGDIVLARDSDDQIWIPYEFYDIFNNDYRVKDLNKLIMSFETFKYCIPYNEKTFKLVGTKDSFQK